MCLPYESIKVFHYMFTYTAVPTCVHAIKASHTPYGSIYNQEEGYANV